MICLPTVGMVTERMLVKFIPRSNYLRRWVSGICVSTTGQTLRQTRYTWQWRESCLIGSMPSLVAVPRRSWPRASVLALLCSFQWLRPSEWACFFSHSSASWSSRVSAYVWTSLWRRKTICLWVTVNVFLDFPRFSVRLQQAIYLDDSPFTFPHETGQMPFEQGVSNSTPYVGILERFRLRPSSKTLPHEVVGRPMAKKFDHFSFQEPGRDCFDFVRFVIKSLLNLNLDLCLSAFHVNAINFFRNQALQMSIMTVTIMSASLP